MLFKTPSFYVSIFFFILVLFGLVQGKVSRRYFGDLYRDENPIAFWAIIIFYAAMSLFFLKLAQNKALPETTGSLANSSVQVAGPVVYPESANQVEYSYYTVEAQPKQSLGSSLHAASPIHVGDRTFFGHTEWSVHWHLKWQENSEARCHLTDVSVESSAKIILPKLVTATVEQQQRFNSFFPALLTHELGHAEFGKQSAKEIEQGLRQLPEMESCQRLDATANELGYRILNAYKNQEIEYDASTQHGKTQGAWLN